MQSKDLGERFEDILQQLSENTRTAEPIRIPSEREIIRKDGSGTVTNINRVVINYGTTEQNHQQYACDCGCGRGCSPGEAVNQILQGRARPRTASDRVVVAMCISAITCALAYFMRSRGLL